MVVFVLFDSRQNTYDEKVYLRPPLYIYNTFFVSCIYWKESEIWVAKNWGRVSGSSEILGSSNPIAPLKTTKGLHI